MLTRQEKRTQKKVLSQREEARTQVEALQAEVERLKGDVGVLAAEEVRKVEKQFNEQLRTAHLDRDKAIGERDALLKDFEGALTAKLDEVRQELLRTREQLHSAQGDSLRLNTALANLKVELDALYVVKELNRQMAEGLSAELKTLKMEDTKQLRKRLQAKTERVAELEREVASLKKAPAVAAPASPLALQNMLNANLRRRLASQAPPPEGAPETILPPVEPQAVETQGVTQITETPAPQP